VIRFVDGPASEVVLTLKRAPLFLRVVRNSRTREWDGLDQLADTPGADEQIFVYLRLGEAGWMHINRGRKGSGIYAMGSYRYYRHEDGTDLGDNAKWQSWCWRQVEAMKGVSA
jgi:hypothetical protein